MGPGSGAERAEQGKRGALSPGSLARGERSESGKQSKENLPPGRAEAPTSPILAGWRFRAQQSGVRGNQSAPFDSGILETGDLEITITSEDQFERAKALIVKSYENS
jgi:hypothetical protein